MPTKHHQARLDQLIQGWIEFKADIANFENIEVHRYMFDHVPDDIVDPIQIDLPVISDSSRRFICSCAYIRLTFINDGKIHRYASLAMSNIWTK